ncbi:MAG: L-threonylcarbamoyladenylate synthase [Vicinamibacterales bacterium]
MPAADKTLSADDPQALDRAADVIARGGVVAVPTETFYGLAADAAHADAVARIFEIKGRPATLALPLVAASLQQVIDLLGSLDAQSEKAARIFWPGPLSLVLSAGNRTVAIRVPAHDFVRALAGRAGVLLTATSANKTGAPPAETARAVAASLEGLVDLIIDGGPTPGGKPSTIADLRGVGGAAPRLVRDGAVAWSRVLESLQ